MGEAIPYQRLADTHIILEDTTYPAEFVLINKHDLKPSFEAGGFQTREVKQDDKIAKIRDNFDPLKIFGKIGEYDGLPLIAKNGEIITGNHRGEAIKNLSGENLAKFREYAKKYFGVDLGDEQIIVRRILDDTEHEQGATLIEQIALAARSNKGSERTLGEQATAALGEYKDKIKALSENPSRRFIESESVDNQKSAVARLLGAELKEDEANLALLASLSKASYNLDIAKALDLIQGNDLLKGKIKNMLISNAGGFYNISNSLELPKLNEITNYLVDAIAYLGKSTLENPNATSINRSEAYRDLAKKIQDRANGVKSFETMEAPLTRFIHETKSDVLGATLAKFANQDFASQRLYEALKEMPDVLIDRFTNASFDFFGNGGYKSVNEIDLYDFLDYMVGKGQQNEATSALKDALISLKKLETSQTPSPNNPTPTNPTPEPTPKQPEPQSPSMPSKTTLEKDLSPQEIKEAIEKWDLDNPSPNDKLLVSLVKGDELEALVKEFDFKGNYALAREIDAEHIHHALQRHSNLDIETSRNQIPITKEDILDYQNIIKTADAREIQNNKIIYKKQINGHYVVVEEALTGQNKLSFITMYKPKGDITPRPTPSLNGHDLDRTLSAGYNNKTIPKTQPKNQAKLSPELEDVRHHFHSALDSTSQDIRTAKEILKQAEQALKDLPKDIAKAKGQEKEILQQTGKLQREADLRKAKANLAKFQQEKAYFKAQSKQLEKAEPILREAESSLKDFSQNPSAKHLAPLHALKNKLYATLEATQNYIAKQSPELNALNAKLNDALESTLSAIDNARANIALKSQNPSQLSPTQAKMQNLKDFIADTRYEVDNLYANNGEVIALKHIIDKIDSTTDKHQLKFLSRLKQEFINFLDTQKPKNTPSKNALETSTPQNPKDEPNLFDTNQNPTQQATNTLKPQQSPKSQQISDKIQSKIDDLVTQYKDLSVKHNEIAQRDLDIRHLSGGIMLNHSSNIKSRDVIMRKQKLLEKRINKLDTLQKFFKGELKSDFWTPNKWNEQSLNYYRKEIEKYANIKPAKEFGTNYAEFYRDGQGGIQKLIAEANAAKEAGQEFSGQVAGAFEKEIDGVLSDIDLVWGNEKFGLAHILAKHPDLDLNLIPQIVEKGKVEKTHNGYNIIYNDFKIGLNVGWNENGVKVGDNKWIVTAFDKTKSLSEKQGSNSASFTKGEALPQNSNNDIIPKIANKFNTEKEHLENLVEAGNDLARLADFAENGNLTAKRILENYKSEPIGRGYIGYSMSVNALDAQANGVKPLSKFNARDAKEVSEILDEKITLKELRELLQEFGDTGEYHHTSKFYNETKHYSIAEMFLNLDSMKKYLAKKNTNKDIIAMNTKAHNKTANLINKAIEFVKNANDIDDKAFILKELKDDLKNSKWHLNFSNKFGSIYDYSEPTTFQYNTLRNNPKFQAYMNEFNPKFDTMADKNLDKGQKMLSNVKPIALPRGF